MKATTLDNMVQKELRKLGALLPVESPESLKSFSPAWPC